MCGIAGIVGGGMSQAKAMALVSGMAGKQQHRGPDNLGFWVGDGAVLAHNRLKIIDLSDDANQPMRYGACIITYNGEIYNYRELRTELKKEGYRFRTQSDTEVVVAAYMRWGAGCVSRFAGMWAFALWNPAERTLFCSRDRFGIKPLYYLHDARGFYFASECKSLRWLPGFDRSLNSAHIKRGLQFGWTSYNGETYYRAIKSLPPGCNLTLTAKGAHIESYWSPDFSADTTLRTREEIQQRFSELMTQSVKSHSVSDVTIGGCLSGGLDSSSIASLYCSLFPDSRYKTFTVYYTGAGNVDERPFAEEVARTYSNIDPHFFTPSGRDIAEHFHRALYHSDVPMITSSSMSQYFVMQRAAAAGVKVVLDGQGADEYLGGYLHSFNRLIGRFIGSYRFAEAARMLMNHRGYHSLKLKQTALVMLKSIYAGFHDEEDIFSYEGKKLRPLLNGSNGMRHIPLSLKPYCGDPMNNFFYHMLYTTSLPTLLHYEDRNSMAFSVEARVPFLDHRLVDFVLRLPVEYKISDRAETKYILRQSLRNVLPPAIAGRRDKKAFVTPGETQWLRNELLELTDVDHSGLEWLNVHQTKKIIGNYRKGDNRNAALVWRICCLNYWLRNIH